MLTKVDITNRRGNVLTLAINEDDNPYQVNEIEGLDPVEATLTSSSYAGNDGEVFQAAKLDARNIKIKLDLDPEFISNTFTTLRQGLYPFFTPKSQIKLRFYSDTGLYVDINGVVEKMSSPLFQQDPAVDISIMCYQPDFTDPRIIQVDGVSVDDNTATILDYPGTVETGTVVTLNLNRPLTDFTIYNMDEGGNILQLDFSGNLLEDDTLVVSSLKGAKGITLTRAAVSSSYLYGRSSQSNWIQLDEGLNNFWVYAEGDPIPYVLEYVVRYGGL
jgi:Phage tail protein